MSTSMRRMGLAAVMLWAGFGWASNPGKAVPSPVREPVYQSKAPRYGLLALGRDGATRVWLVFDSVPDPLQPGKHKDYLYVDRNGNGDLTESGERVEAVVHEHEESSRLGGVQPSKTRTHEFPVGEIKDREGTTYKDVTVTVQWFVARNRPCRVEASVAGRGTQAAAPYELVFADRPQDAPVLRFGGPLTLRFALGIRHALSLTEEFNVQAEVGTAGRGPGSFVFLMNDAVPEDIHPVAEIAWPHREAGQPPIKTRVTLDRRC